MKVGDMELRAEGAVRVMHPDVGMGVEFKQATPEQRNHVEKFIQTLMNAGDLTPELLVEPEGLEGDAAASGKLAVAEVEDPLLDLFQQKAALPTELFLNELRSSGRRIRRTPRKRASCRFSFSLQSAVVCHQESYLSYK